MIDDAGAEVESTGSAVVLVLVLAALLAISLKRNPNKPI